MIAETSIGLIIPSGNRLTEPQFNTYLPPGVGIHVTRLRMTGKWRKPWNELKPQLAEAAAILSDVKPGVLVFHCTANSMENGLAHETAIVETVQQASGCPTLTTAQAVREAFTRCAIKKLVLISPYVQETNQLEVSYLSEAGFTVLHELGLGLETHAYSSVTPEEWIRIVKDNARTEADGYFLSCTDTRMIEAIEELERQLEKPVVNSNQATLWSCLQKLGLRLANQKLGRLFSAG